MIRFLPLVASLLPLRSVRERTHLLTGGMREPNIAVGADNRDRSDAERLVQVCAFALPATLVFCLSFALLCLPSFSFSFLRPAFTALLLIFLLSQQKYHSMILVLIGALIYNCGVSSDGNS